MISFDVASLYANIAITDTLDIIKDCVDNNEKFTSKTAIPQDKLLELVILV